MTQETYVWTVDILPPKPSPIDPQDAKWLVDNQQAVRAALKELPR